MSRNFIPRRIVQEILEIARHRGDFVLFQNGDMYDCRNPEPEYSIPSGISAGRTGLHYYHVGVPTRPVRKELRPVFTRMACTRPNPATLQDLTGDPCSGRRP